MKPFVVQRSQLGEALWIGATLALDLRDAEGRITLRKGTVLGPEDADRLVAVPWDELHLVQLDGEDSPEAEAGLQLAQVAAGTGCRVARSSAGGHWAIESSHRGILQVTVDALQSINLIEGLAVYTLYHGQVVDGGEVVARAKIAPFAVPHAALACAQQFAGQGVISVRPFMAKRVGAVVSESLGAAAMARFRQSLQEKVTWLGSDLLAPAFVAADPKAVVEGLSAMVHQQSDVILVAGSRPKDPLDPTYVALTEMGAVFERRGVPAHPGSLAWLARLGEVTVVGMPSCGLFSKATVFDLIFPRLLAGERISARDLAALGHGGFLTKDMAFRFPPYRPARERGEIE
ncbi:MAG: hypothetical protein U0132_05775 [Gemmatimonadaceae bacterium]